MNKNFNKLPRNNISSGKVTGKIKNKTNLPLVTDINNHITDTFTSYRKSKFQFSDFYNKVIQDHSWINKPRFLLEAKNGVLYKNTPVGLELAFRDLISYYYDLDAPLQRLYSGYHDSMFVRFALKIGIFTTQHHWEMVHRCWEIGFAKAVRVYYLYIHPTYDPTSNLPYTVFFDTHFSNRLYFEILDVVYAMKKEVEMDAELIRLSQLSRSQDDLYFYKQKSEAPLI